jgi:hypothetical protein
MQKIISATAKEIDSLVVKEIFEIGSLFVRLEIHITSTSFRSNKTVIKSFQYYHSSFISRG